MAATYKLKLFCANCGMRDFYDAPSGSEFWPMSTEGAIGNTYESSYLELENGRKRDMCCSNCDVPCLQVEPWDKSELALIPLEESARG